MLLNAFFSVAFFVKVLICYIFLSVFSSMMSMASALTNHWFAACSSYRGYTSNRSDGCFKVLSWNHKGLPTEKVASTVWQITRAAPKDTKKVSFLTAQKRKLLTYSWRYLNDKNTRVPIPR